MVIPNLRERLICPKCEIKLRELDMQKNYNKCDTCGAIWQLVIEGGLKLKRVYPDENYEGPRYIELISFEDLLAL